MLNKIRSYRTAAGLTLDQLADRLGVSASQVIKLERGERRLTLDWMERLAQVFGIRPSDLIESASIPFVGWLRITGEVSPYGEDEEAGYAPDAPPNIPSTCVALEVDQGGLGPLVPGGLAYFDQVGLPPEARLVGSLCVAWAVDGAMFGGRLTYGAAGRWGMIFGDGRIRYDLSLSKVSPVLWLRLTPQANR